MSPTSFTPAQVVQVLTEARMHRIRQADPNDPGSITITRAVFDDLISLAEAAARAAALSLHESTLTVWPENGSYRATIVHSTYGSVNATGATLLDSIVLASGSLQGRLERMID